MFLGEPDSDDKCRGLLSILEPCGGLMNMYLQNEREWTSFFPKFFNSRTTLSFEK